MSITKINGVNLGGWLVLEKWMAPSLFAETKADDEYYLAHDLSQEAYQARIQIHRGEFITESDFARIAKAGFNLVRIPVPYFVFGDRPPFLGCTNELDKAFNWAQAYNLKILLDLHSVPGSQNAFDNGGLSGVLKWGQDPDEVEFCLRVLERLAERYKNHPALWGVQPLNEPVTDRVYDNMKPMERYPARDAKIAEGSKPLTMPFLQEYYLDAYTRLRKILNKETVIAFHDAFELSAWKSFFSTNQFENVMLDTHQYLMMAEQNGTKQELKAYIEFLDHLGSEIADVISYVPVFVGEWSLFNSYATGVDTKGGINPTQQEFSAMNKMSSTELATIYRQLWEKSLATWLIGGGHFYWTYKLNIDTINEPAWFGWDSWDLSRCLMNEWASKSIEV